MNSDEQRMLEESKAAFELDMFEKELKGFDWFYEMSDDSRVFHRGQNRYAGLKAKARQLGHLGMQMMNRVHEESTRSHYNDLKMKAPRVFSDKDINEAKNPRVRF